MPEKHFKTMLPLTLLNSGAGLYYEVNLPGSSPPWIASIIWGAIDLGCLIYAVGPRNEDWNFITSKQTATKG